MEWRGGAPAGCIVEARHDAVRQLFDLCDAIGNGFVTSSKAVEVGTMIAGGDEERVRHQVASLEEGGLVEFDGCVRLLKTLCSGMTHEVFDVRLARAVGDLREKARARWMSQPTAEGGGTVAALGGDVTVHGLYLAAAGASGGVLRREKLEPLIAALAPQLTHRERRKMVLAARETTAHGVSLEEVLALLGRAPLQGGGSTASLPTASADRAVAPTRRSSSPGAIAMEAAQPFKRGYASGTSAPRLRSRSPSPGGSATEAARVAAVLQETRQLRETLLAKSQSPERQRTSPARSAGGFSRSPVRSFRAVQDAAEARQAAPVVLPLDPPPADVVSPRKASQYAGSPRGSARSAGPALGGPQVAQVRALLKENAELRLVSERLRDQVTKVSQLKVESGDIAAGLEERCAGLESELAVERAERKRTGEAEELLLERLQRMQRQIEDLNAENATLMARDQQREARVSEMESAQEAIGGDLEAARAALEGKEALLKETQGHAHDLQLKLQGASSPAKNSLAHLLKGDGAAALPSGSVGDRSLHDEHVRLREQAAHALQPHGYDPQAIYSLVTRYDNLVVLYDKRLHETRRKLHQHSRRVQQAEAEFVRLASHLQAPPPPPANTDPSKLPPPQLGTPSPRGPASAWSASPGAATARLPEALEQLHDALRTLSEAQTSASPRAESVESTQRRAAYNRL